MADLPTGTVTFLFTDIEGSTKLAQGHPAEWESVRQRHHSILRAAAKAHRGYVFQVVGDAFCIAFYNAFDAIAASVSAQRALQAEAWSETVIRVLMGLHTGTAEARDGEYHGYLTLATAQQAMSAAYGGQTLVSNATAALLAGQLPAGVTLRDMGENRLKSLLNPEHLWQVVAPDVLIEFPPLRTLYAIPNNLPIEVTSFIGRERELTEIRQLLTTTRLLTLTGSGGTGKTRLTLRAAAEVLDQYHDGIWFVELVPLADPALVPQTVANVLGVREQPGRPMLATLIDWLRPKQLLLILDNCEHLIGACAKFADAVLHASRESRTLVSSREALSIAGETAYHVPSLTSPDPRESLPVAELEKFEAVQLFVQRARTVKSSFVLSSTNAPVVAQICHRLDGVPLAIELAASRVQALSVDQIAARLDNRFRLLTGGSRTALPRQQTLRALIDWSYDLLSEPEQVLLRRLSVFAGGWSLDAAEAVCAGEGLEVSEVLDLLTRLVEKSLVVEEERDGEARYRMLETIHQYALEKLSHSDEVQRVPGLHLDFYLKLAEEAEPKLHGDDQMLWLDRLEMDKDNLRAALERALEHDPDLALRLIWALGEFWHDRLTETLKWVNKLLPQTEAWGITARRARALTLAGRLNVVDAQTARSFYRKSLEIARTSADEREIAYALTGLGRSANILHDFQTARTFFEEALPILQKLGDQGGVAATLARFGYTVSMQGDNKWGHELLEQSIIIFRALGDKLALGNPLNLLGQLAQLQGDYKSAAKYYEEAMETSGLTRNKFGRARAFRNLGYVMLHEGDYRRARTRFMESLALYREEGAQHEVVMCLAGLAGVMAAVGQSDQSARTFGAVDALCESMGTVMHAIDRFEYDHSLSTLRTQFDQGLFEGAWTEGRALTLEQAVALAQA